MHARTDLLLHHQVLLLALHDDEGTVHPSMLGQALGCAIVAELLLRGRVRIEEVRRSKLLGAPDPAPIGDPLLDEVLERIRTARRRASVSTWVTRIATTKRLRHRVAEALCERGVLEQRQGRVLWVFSRDVYPTVDPEPERRLVERLSAAVAADAGVAVDPRTGILIALTYRTGILRHVLGKDVLRRRKARLEAIARMEAVGEAADTAIQAVQAAQAAMIAMTAATASITVTAR